MHQEFDSYQQREISSVGVSQMPIEKTTKPNYRLAGEMIHANHILSDVYQRADLSKWEDGSDVCLMYLVSTEIDRLQGIYTFSNLSEQLCKRHPQVAKTFLPTNLKRLVNKFSFPVKPAQVSKTLEERSKKSFALAA